MLLRLPVLVVEVRRKSNQSFLLANAISHVNYRSKKKVPSGSQSEVLPSTSTQSERDDWTHSQHIHNDDENKMLHSTRLDQHLRVASSILKDICDPILKKNCINVIDLDVGKGLRKNMIVNDMNS